MSSELTYNQIEELLPAFALGSLEPDEMLAVDTFVQNHPELQVRLNEIEETLTQLAYAAPDAPLPADVKQHLIIRARADLDPAIPHTPTISQHTQPVRETQQRRSQSIPQLDNRRNSGSWLAGWRRQGVRLATGALALLLIGVYFGQVQLRLNDAEARLRTMQAAVAQLQRQQDDRSLQEIVVRLQEQQQEDRRLLAVLANPEQTVVVPGTQLAPAARGTFYRSGDEGLLVVEGLAPLPETQTYQFWLVIDGQPTPFGLLAAQPDKPTLLAVTIPPEAQNFTIVDVSIEQAGGSETINTETVVLRGSVS